MIAEIGGMENGEIKLNPLYQFKEEKGQEKRKQSLRKGGTEISLVNGNLEKVGELQNKEKLEAAGYQLWRVLPDGKRMGTLGSSGNRSLRSGGLYILSQLSDIFRITTARTDVSACT